MSFSIPKKRGLCSRPYAAREYLANRALAAADTARDDDCVFKLRHFAFKFDIKLEPCLK